MGVGPGRAWPVPYTTVLGFPRWQRWEKGGPAGRPRRILVKAWGTGPRTSQAPRTAASATIFPRC